MTSNTFYRISLKKPQYTLNGFDFPYFENDVEKKIYTDYLYGTLAQNPLKQTSILNHSDFNILTLRIQTNTELTSNDLINSHHIQINFGTETRYYFVDNVKFVKKDVWNVNLNLDYWLTYWTKLPLNPQATAFIERKHWDRWILKLISGDGKKLIVPNLDVSSAIWNEDSQFNNLDNYLPTSNNFNSGGSAQGLLRSTTDNIIDGNFQFGNLAVGNSKYAYAFVNATSSNNQWEVNNDWFSNNDLPIGIYMVPVVNQNDVSIGNLNFENNTYSKLANLGSGFVSNIIFTPVPIVEKFNEDEYQVLQIDSGSGGNISIIVFKNEIVEDKIFNKKQQGNRLKNRIWDSTADFGNAGFVKSFFSLGGFDANTTFSETPTITFTNNTYNNISNYKGMRTLFNDDDFNNLPFWETNHESKTLFYKKFVYQIGNSKEHDLHCHYIFNWNWGNFILPPTFNEQAFYNIYGTIFFNTSILLMPHIVSIELNCTSGLYAYYVSFSTFQSNYGGSFALPSSSNALTTFYEGSTNAYAQAKYRGKVGIAHSFFHLGKDLGFGQANSISQYKSVQANSEDKGRTSREYNNNESLIPYETYIKSINNYGDYDSWLYPQREQNISRFNGTIKLFTLPEQEIEQIAIFYHKKGYLTNTIQSFSNYTSFKTRENFNFWKIIDFSDLIDKENGYSTKIYKWFNEKFREGITLWFKNNDNIWNFYEYFKPNRELSILTQIQPKLKLKSKKGGGKD